MVYGRTTERPIQYPSIESQRITCPLLCPPHALPSPSPQRRPPPRPSRPPLSPTTPIPSPPRLLLQVDIILVPRHVLLQARDFLLQRPDPLLDLRLEAVRGAFPGGRLGLVDDEVVAALGRATGTVGVGVEISRPGAGGRAGGYEGGALGFAAAVEGKGVVETHG